MKPESIENDDLWNELGNLTQEMDATCTNAQKLFEAKVNAYADGFEDARSEKISTNNKSSSKLLYFTSSLAAAFLLSLSFWGGSLYHSQSISTNNLRDEIQSLRQMLVLQQLNLPSAPQRIEGLQRASKWFEADKNIMQVILTSINDDPNNTVRLSALEAIRAYLHSKEMRAILIDSFESQESFIVQMEILRLIAEFGEPTEYLPLLDQFEAQKIDPTLIQKIRKQLKPTA